MRVMMLCVAPLVVATITTYIATDRPVRASHRPVLTNAQP